MAVSINGTGSITGLSVGGLPDATVTPTELSQPFTSGSPQATTSGTSWSFGSIPSWVKRITILVSGFSTNGTSVPIVQIGDSGGLETSGYSGATLNSGAVAAYPSSGFPLTVSHTAAFVVQGTITLSLIDAATNTWVNTLSTARTDAAQVYVGAGVKALSSTLTTVTLTTVGGTDAGDAGAVNVFYE
jgi:hypothetical protein